MSDAEDRGAGPSVRPGHGLYDVPSVFYFGQNVFPHSEGVLKGIDTVFLLCFGCEIGSHDDFPFVLYGFAVSFRLTGIFCKDEFRFLLLFFRIDMDI